MATKYQKLIGMDECSFRSYLDNTDFSSITKKNKNIIFAKILEFRDDLKEFSRNKPYIVNAFLRDLCEPMLSRATWDYNGRVIENQVTSLHQLIDINKSTSDTKFDNPFLAHLYLRGVDLSFPYLLHLNREQFYDEIFTKPCTNCGKIIKGIYKPLMCSDKCVKDACSKRMSGDGNSVHKIKDKKAWKKNCSLGTKISIANGSWTPCVTNSWAGSLIDISGQKYRSSWEVCFHLVNKDCHYEKCRIPYLFNDNHHTYIVDFVDYEKQIIYEAKPDSEINSGRNLAKFEAAKCWALENDYEFEIIGNLWFKENNEKYALEYAKLKHKILDENHRRKIENNIKQFRVV